MKIQIYQSLFAEGGFLKLNLKLWKYLCILEIVLWLILRNFFFTIVPIALLYCVFRILTAKDPKLIELIVSNSSDKNKYYNP